MQHQLRTEPFGLQLSFALSTTDFNFYTFAIGVQKYNPAHVTISAPLLSTESGSDNLERSEAQEESTCFASRRSQVQFPVFPDLSVGDHGKLLLLQSDNTDFVRPMV